MADSDPITWQLALLLQSQLQKVLVANGYRTNIGAVVLVEETQVQAGAPMPTFVDVNVTERNSDAAVNRRQRSVSFTVEAFVAATLATAKFKAHCVIDDIERVLDQEADIAPKGFRMGRATHAQIDARPEGMDVIKVTVTGTAKYLR